MNEGFGIQSRRLSPFNEFSCRIEEILNKISRLQKSDNANKGFLRKLESKKKKVKGPELLPVLTFTKTPIFRNLREGSVDVVKKNKNWKNQTLALVKNARVHRRSLFIGENCFTEISPNASPSLQISKVPLKESPIREKYKKILNMTQRMISKDNLRGWSRN